MSFANPTVGSISWFAKHEFNLSWRDFVRMMSAGKPGRERAILGFILFAVVVIHGLAYLVLSPAIKSGLVVDKALFAAITGSLLLTVSLMMSQAMELVTRVFYSRSDLDLILSSPVSARRIFIVRIGAIAVATAALSLLIFGSAINILAIFDDVRWLAAYPVIIACGALSTAISLGLTILMFETIGAKRTRLVSQIIAAVVGAGFIIGIQLAAIASLGSISRFEFLTSNVVVDSVPDLQSWIWIPARAVMGDLSALFLAVAGSFAILGTTMLLFAQSFGERVIVAAGISQTHSEVKASVATFNNKSHGAVLRNKEWKLLLRDHWLVSQTLMQILYLIPPAFMLWQGFGNAGALAVVAIPVLVMAAGQLAGGLAWLAISGEDAPQLVQTAPVANGAVIRAKVEAVLGAIAIVVSPILLLIAYFDLKSAAIAAIGISVATVSATMIQLWFRSQAKRSNFRRRQTSSKVATLAEAFSSILWAGTTGLIAAGVWILAPITVLLALGTLWIARSFRPQQEN
ncbi:MAG: permease [Pseudomonadota bacterium]